VLPAAPDRAPSPRRRRGRSAIAALGVLLLSLGAGLGGLALVPNAAPATRAAAGETLLVAGSEPANWDPVRSSDVATANTLAQVFEGVTTFDAEAGVQPALAESWRVEEEGRRIVFTLRPGVRFSDGTTITAEHVVESWLRVLDPEQPSPLWSLLGDVQGAAEYRAGDGRREDVGVRAQGSAVVVDFRRPASYFPAAAGSVTLAVLPEGLGERISAATSGVPEIVASGGYVPSDGDAGAIALTANEQYWAGPPAIESAELVTDFGGVSSVEAFETGDVHLAEVSALDARWIPYDEALGPQLRRLDEFSVTYYGFDTTQPPFDDARVRRAFAGAVDWDRLLQLADPTATPVTSLVPAGIPGRSETDFTPEYDPEAARAELAGAGYPDGRDFPTVRLITGGSGFDEAIALAIERELGVTVDVETQLFGGFFERLETDPPAFWSLNWIADYPDPHDFLGLLLESGSGSNYGGWSSAEYDAAIEAAASTADEAERVARFDDAQRILQREAPIVPVAYGDAWALGDAGLLGGTRNGLGLYRIAGMAWAAE
jgi:ABC-type transport system substrate-binding protein